MKRQTSIILVALCVMILGACQNQTNSIPSRVAAEIGSAASEIVLAKLENGQRGEMVKLSALRGKPVALNFWATWCEPCQEEFPVLDAAFRKYRESNDLQVIGVNVQDTATPETVQNYLAETGVLFPIWLDADGTANRAYNIQALPTTFFIDRSGVIRQMRIGGPLTREYVEQQLEKIR